jgi:DnaJ-class molecular chaperone
MGTSEFQSRRAIQVILGLMDPNLTALQSPTVLQSLAAQLCGDPCPMADPYEVLGVKREASADEIRKAYRRLAKKNHPDLNPGDAAAEARFKEIASANDILSDAKKRVQFDNGEIDSAGLQRPPQQDQHSYRAYAEAPGGSKYDRPLGNAGGDDRDLFAELFGSRGRRPPSRGDDVHYTLAVDFLDAINGNKKRVVMADGRTLDIAIPIGLMDGQTLRLRGQGQPGIDGAPAGDVLVETHVGPHKIFRRDGRDIHSTLAVTVGEALSGAKVSVPTVAGTVQMTLPKGANTGTIVRLRGKGVPLVGAAGDQLVELRVMLPTLPDTALIQAIEQWEAANPYNPRHEAVS